MRRMKWQNNADCTVPLAVGAFIISSTVADPVVAVGVYLCQPDESMVKEVFAGSPDTFANNAVVTWRQLCIRDDQRRHNTMLTSTLVLPPDSVQVGDSLETFGRARERIEHFAPEDFRN